MSEAELFARLAEDRLRSRCSWAGVLLGCSLFIPYEVIDEQPQMLWQLYGELPAAGVVAALAPALAGLAVLLGRYLTRRGASLAVVVLASLLGAQLCHRLGAEASAWGLLPLPQSFAGRAPTALLALALTAAGSNLAFRPDTRRRARLLLWGGVAAAMLFYAWPGRGEAPGATVIRGLSLIGDLPTVHFKLGAITLSVVALWPALCALLGLVHTRRPPSRQLSALGMLSLFGFPLVLVMLLFAWMLRAGAGAAFFGAAGAAAQIIAVLALLAGAFEVLGERRPEAPRPAPVAARPTEPTGDGTASSPDEVDPEACAAALDAMIEREAERAERALDAPTGWPLGRTIAVAGAVVLLCAAGQWWLARPPGKGVRWQLDAPSKAADELFGELVPRWSDARWRWDRRVHDDSGAAAMLAVKARASALTTAAVALDPELGRSMAAMTRAAERLDVSTRGWYRLVADVNGACHRRGLPYYLDPRVSVSKTRDGLRRHFMVGSYRVERVRRFELGGEPLAALHVRPLGTSYDSQRLGYLGLSRDVQPYALVALDTIDEHASELAADAARSPPRCGESFDPAAKAAMLDCGERLASLARELGGRFAPTETAGTERHELQHQVDGPLLRLARPVVRKLGAYADEIQDRVNRELSAYLAEVSGAVSPRLSLVTPLRFAVLQDRGSYHHTAVLLFEALAGRQLCDSTGATDRPAVAAAFAELAQGGDDGLRRRATRAWEELFGERLPPARLLEESIAPPSSPP